MSETKISEQIRLGCISLYYIISKGVDLSGSDQIKQIGLEQVDQIKYRRTY